MINTIFDRTSPLDDGFWRNDQYEYDSDADDDDVDDDEDEKD